ncbi:DUF6211 family protein [Streptomyces sp. NPDC001568]|uniref:DUF6211 family protein n=1 Tax=Streptomyces sp. NPDC001568 TaxID=3364588 RepID=UPI0036922DBA
MVDPVPTDLPRPYDHVHLHPDNRLGADPATPYLVVDVLDTEPPTIELWHLADHPDHQDWAGTASLADIALVVRVTTGDTRTWTPSK